MPAIRDPVPQNGTVHRFDQLVTNGRRFEGPDLRTQTRVDPATRCFRNQLLLLNTYLVLTKPLSHDIQCQRCVSVKIGCKYLDNWSLSSLRQHWMTEAP